MITVPHTLPILAADPATSTMVALTPVNLATVSVSPEPTLVWNARLDTGRLVVWVVVVVQTCRIMLFKK